MLLNKSQLAAQLNVDRRFVTAMCAQGFQFLFGGRTTVESAITWLAEKGTAFRGIQRRAKKKRRKQPAQPLLQ